MLGDFVTRALTLVLGYAYPAFECFKMVEKDVPNVDQLRFWCQYWIIIAMLTAFERLFDPFVSWFPLYGELKLAFLIYLWHPKSKGTRFIYETFLKPYIASYEMDIDRKLQELKAKSGELLLSYIERLYDRGQFMVFEILQFLAARSPSATQGREPQVPPPPPATANGTNKRPLPANSKSSEKTRGTKTEETLRGSFRRSRP